MADAWDELIARHGLTSGETVRIRDEVGTGRAFAEPHMRAAAAEWARHRLEAEGLGQLWATRWRPALLVVWLVAFVGAFLWRLSTHRVGRAVDGLWAGLGIIALNLLAWWNRRRLLRETIRRNEGPVDGGEHTRGGGHLW